MLVLYLRVSTEEQAESGLGIEAQRHACLAWAAREGGVVRGEFVDDGLSGSLPASKRPGLLDAIDSLQTGDTLVVAKRDRICRGDAVSMAMIEAAVNRRKARIVSAAGEGTADDDPSSILMRRIIDAFGEYELLLIRRRTRNALAAKIRKGERCGQIPYGKRLADDGVTLVTAGEEWKAIEAVIRWRAQGYSLRKIAAQLDQTPLRPKNGNSNWSESSIRSILKRASASA